MTACLLAGATVLSLAAGEFTLEWTHSVERVRWRETWQLRSGGLALLEARVKGSGAGMEPGEGARLVDGWWVWSPGTWVPSLTLAASGATGGGWTLCADGGCRELGAAAGEAVVLQPCR
jgi:hypothetical protein